MKHLQEKLSEGHTLLDVQQETTEQMRHKEIELSTDAMIVQADTLK